MKVTVKSKNIFLQYYNNFKVYVNLTIVQFIVLPSFLSIYRFPFNSFLWIIPVCPSNPETFSRRRTIKSVCQEKNPHYQPRTTPACRSSTCSKTMPQTQHPDLTKNVATFFMRPEKFSNRWCSSGRRRTEMHL